MTKEEQDAILDNMTPEERAHALAFVAGGGKAQMTITAESLK